MKKTYLLIGAGILIAAQSYAQPSKATLLEPGLSQEILTIGENNAQTKIIKSGAKGGGSQLYFSEDFSNGFAGQGANGAWTTDGANGNLWFQSFPIGAPNGYSATTPVAVPQQAAYGLFLPNYFGTQTTIASVTAANGFMMMDADRFNSTRIATGGDSAPLTTSNSITTMLVSPVIDLSAVVGTPAILTFAQRWRMCCNDYKLIVEVSLDGGGSWITGTELDIYTENAGQGNLIIEGLSILDLGTISTNATDLSTFRFRILWDDLGLVAPNPITGAANNTSHYYFMIDDVEISSAPQNELVVGSTYINDYFFTSGDAPDVEYVKAFEYWDQPAYLKRPFNFIAEVTNNGSTVQTGVVLTVEFEDPSLAIETFTSEPISIAPGETAYPSVDDVTPAAWVSPANGVYTSRFSVSQDQDDQFPDNNIGLQRTTRINSEATPGAIFQNDRNAFTTLYPTLGQDVIFANRFAYNETDATALAITHIEYVLSGSPNGPTQIGEPFYLNIRSGSIFEAEGPQNVMTRYFGDDECEVITEAGTLSSGATINWLSYEFPSAVLIDPNTIYQGEIQVPASGGNIVIPAASNLQEDGCSGLYDFAAPSAGPQGWFSLGTNAAMIRFRTNSISSVNNISYESGIKVTQNWPNPFNNETNIQYQLDQTGNVTFEVYDVAGKLVYIENLGLRSAMSVNVFSFQKRTLEAGIYTYSIVTNGERVTRKMIVE